MSLGNVQKARGSSDGEYREMEVRNEGRKGVDHEGSVYVEGGVSRTRCALLSGKIKGEILERIKEERP